MRRRCRPAPLLLLALLPLAACAGQGDADRDETLTVFAAASLTGPFTELAAEYEREHPGVAVRLSFGGSSDLVAQLAEGARADVFASADTVTMDRLAAADLVAGDPVEFATNTLMIAVPPGNPAGIGDLADLARPGVTLVLCQPEVPCGRAALAVGEAAGLAWDPVSEEESVSGVLTKVADGEADAGLVYVTDVAAAGDDVEGIAFPEAADAVNHYPIAALEGSEHAALAGAWIDLVLGEGRTVLQDAGFGAPAP